MFTTEALDCLCYKQESSRLLASISTFFFAVGLKLSRFRTIKKKSENALCQYVITSIFLFDVLWGLVKNWG